MFGAYVTDYFIGANQLRLHFWREIEIAGKLGIKPLFGYLASVVPFWAQFILFLFFSFFLNSSNFFVCVKVIVNLNIPYYIHTFLQC